jgi:hypothetical protein
MCAYLTCRPLTGGQLIVPIKDLLFVTWHRPYVALFEVRGLSLELDWIIKLKSLQQVLVSHAVRIAAEYPPDLQPEYVAAAQSLRQPYWDWASDSTIPPAAYAVNVTVRAPCGVIEIPNPLCGYRFQQVPVESTFGGFLATYPQTIRCLGEGCMLSNITASNKAMTLAAEDLTSDVVCHPSRSRPKRVDEPIMPCELWRRLTGDSMISLPGQSPLTALAGAFRVSNFPTIWFMHCQYATGPFRTSTGRLSTPCCMLFIPHSEGLHAD